MFRKNQQVFSFCCYIVLGISFIFWANNLTAQIAIASKPITSQPIAKNQNLNPQNLEAAAKQAYHLNNYQQALNLWQQALTIYQQNQDTISQARVISHLALLKYQLGDLKTAYQDIQTSRELLESKPNSNDNIELDRHLAQVFNNQGIIELALGKYESAIDCWEKAIAAYQRADDELGVIRTQLNQAKAFKKIGLYQRAIDTLTTVNQALENQPDSPLKSMGFRNYGNVLSLKGNFKEAQSVLEASLAIASRLSLVTEEIKTRLALGNILVANTNPEDESNYEVASKHYQKAIELCESVADCANTDLLLQINLAQLNLGLKTELWTRVINLTESIQQQFSHLPLDRVKIDLKIGFANSLLELKQRTAEIAYLSSKKPSWAEIIALLDSAIEEAQQLNYPQGESYSWGLKGRIQEILTQWDRASESTAKALVIAQKINAPEISYLWEWQSGRIDRARGNKELAIAHYRQGVTLLNSLSQDIASIERNIQFSFRNSIEPVYRETVALLLDVPPGETVSQENLIQARATIESLQLAELNNFFREACLKSKPVSIDSIDPHAVAIYPIILSDRLAVIVSLPNQPLIHYSVLIPQEELEATINELRQTVVIRSRRTFFQPATKLYSWLIAPVSDLLAQHQIETIVFVPDGALRNIPLAALYDGNKYLIEQYNLVLNPGLQLLSPRSLQETELETLAVGLTKERANFSALKYVDRELAEIEEQVESSILINEEFTTEAFQNKIKFSDYPIVHIATHGQFGSSLEDTFLLAWDNRIDLNLLNKILQTRTATGQKAIELLILSACETATGDKQAALGLAGMAIQAGARSTVATLWSINDRATAELMSTLYQQISTKSVGKAEAIRQAQLSLLRNPQYRHPFYWAAYTMIGNWL